MPAPPSPGRSDGLSQCKRTVISQAAAGAPAFQLGTWLVLEDRTPLGAVEEVFGPVLTPMYAVQAPPTLPAGAVAGTAVYGVDRLSTVVPTDELRAMGFNPAEDEGAQEGDADPDATFSDDEAVRTWGRRSEGAGRGRDPARHAWRTAWLKAGGPPAFAPWPQPTPLPPEPAAAAAKVHGLNPSLPPPPFLPGPAASGVHVEAAVEEERARRGQARGQAGRRGAPPRAGPQPQPAARTGARSPRPGRAPARIPAPGRVCTAAPRSGHGAAPRRALGPHAPPRRIWRAAAGVRRVPHAGATSLHARRHDAGLHARTSSPPRPPGLRPAAAPPARPGPSPAAQLATAGSSAVIVAYGLSDARDV